MTDARPGRVTARQFVAETYRKAPGAMLLVLAPGVLLSLAVEAWAVSVQADAFHAVLGGIAFAVCWLLTWWLLGNGQVQRYIRGKEEP